MKTVQKISKMPNLGKGIAYNILIALIALGLTWLLKGPYIDIEFGTAVFVSAVLFVLFFSLVIASTAPSRGGSARLAGALSKRAFGGKQSRANFKGLPRDFRSAKIARNDDGVDPYKYIRHPVYSGIIFFLNPALAIYFRSWLYLAACVLIYFIWRNLAKNEELKLAKTQGKEYSQYRLKTTLFFPNLFAINMPFAFVLSGVIIFILAFVALNFSSLSFRYVGWDNTTEVQLPYGSPTSVNSVNSALAPQILPQAQDVKYDKPNSIVIEKLGIDTPLVLSQGQTQKELNADLDKGVIIYPGSAMPGEIGNFFVTGHSSVYFWNKTPYGRIFATLDKLEAGDRVVVYYDQYKYEYEITKKLVLSSKDVHIYGTDERIITLMTCWPIGTNLKRLVLEGRLVR